MHDADGCRWSSSEMLETQECISTFNICRVLLGLLLVCVYLFFFKRKHRYGDSYKRSLIS